MQQHLFVCSSLIFLLDSGDKILGNLVRDIYNMRATLDRRNRIGERNLLELSIQDGERDLPKETQSVRRRL